MRRLSYTRRVVALLACACLVAGATVAGGAVADASAQEPVTAVAPAAPADPVAQPAPRRFRAAYGQWRSRLKRHRVHVGRNLLAQATAADASSRPPTKRELRRSIHRMQRRWSSWLRHNPRGRAIAFKLKVRRGVPSWGKAQLRSIAWCESKNDPRAIGGGGAYRGMYQFSVSTWAVVGGSGDPVSASRWEQTWRAWLLLSRHGSGHWPVCG